MCRSQMEMGKVLSLLLLTCRPSPVEPVGFPTREPMLAEGNVDAVTGFNFSSYLSLARLGVPEDDITTILFADHGVELYGNVVIVNTDFAEANPEIVTAALGAIARGVADAARRPGRRCGCRHRPQPRRGCGGLRPVAWNWRSTPTSLTPWVLENGLGGIDTDRMATAIEQLRLTYEFQNEPDMAMYFTDAYLPPAEMRMIAP